MLNRIFPEKFDNAYRGHWLGLWLFVAIVAVRLAIGVNSILNTRLVATGPDAIPLASYDAGAQQAVLSLFALLGLSLVLFGLPGAVALIRYRTMIPFLYLLLLIQQLGGRVLSLMHPIATSGASGAGSAIMLVLLAATVFGFFLSLRNSPASP
jgi:hypothetical protein